MPSRLHESPRLPHDPEPAMTGRAAEPSSPDMHPAATTTPPPGPHAGFDEDLNPVDDEFINTHGSER